MKLLRAINITFVGLCALLVVAVHVPVIPYVGPFGSGIVPPYSLWFIILPLFIESAVLIRSDPGHRRVAKLLCAGALLVAIGSSIVLVRQLSAAHEAGVRIDAIRLLQIKSIKSGPGPDKIVQYDRDERGTLPMAIYLPKRELSEASAPVLIDVHGGGWIGGSMLDHNRDLRWYADQGWLVFSPDYTWSTPQVHLWNRSIEQVGCAMAWVEANALTLGGDPSAISMFGDSAGGNLVMNAAYMANVDRLRSDCGGIVPHTRAVVATYPVVDAVSFYENRDALLGTFSRRMASEYVGGTPKDYSQRYSAIGTGTFLTRDAPPTLILVGEADHLVPPESTYSFADRATRIGAKIALIRVPYGEHVFDGAEGSVGNQLVRNASAQFLRLNGGTRVGSK